MSNDLALERGRRHKAGLTFFAALLHPSHQDMQHELASSLERPIIWRQCGTRGYIGTVVCVTTAPRVQPYATRASRASSPPSRKSILCIEIPANRLYLMITRARSLSTTKLLEQIVLDPQDRNFHALTHYSASASNSTLAGSRNQNNRKSPNSNLPRTSNLHQIVLP